ncbi:MAG: hypothetical protein ABI091_06245 [Ferruginibacter sp.]
MATFFISSNLLIDPWSYLKSCGRYSNAARALTRAKGLKNNAGYVIEGQKAYMDATRNIEKCEEILVACNKEYWDVTKSNNKL